MLPEAELELLLPGADADFAAPLRPELKSITHPQRRKKSIAHSKEGKMCCLGWTAPPLAVVLHPPLLHRTFPVICLAWVDPGTQPNENSFSLERN